MAVTTKTVKKPAKSKKPTKTARLEVRLTPEQKARIERAAEIAGRSVSDYVVNRLANADFDPLPQSHPILVSEEDYLHFVHSLENPPEPNEALRKAWRAYKASSLSR